MGCPPSMAEGVEENWPDLGRQAVGAAGGRFSKVKSQDFWNPEDHERISESGTNVFILLRFGFALAWLR